MTRDERFPDDPVLRRVAAARPPIPEQDFPTAERAAAIADRVVRSGRPVHAARSRVTTRWSERTHRRPVVLGTLGLAAAAACVALLIAALLPGSSRPHGRVAADLIQIRLVPAQDSGSGLPLGRRIMRTPLGAQISRAYQATQENVQTGDAAQNRTAIARLTSNEEACEQAATAINRVHARPGQRAFQRYWVQGVRLQATGDRELIAALRVADAGRKAAPSGTWPRRSTRWTAVTASPPMPRTRSGSRPSRAAPTLSSLTLRGAARRPPLALTQLVAALLT